MKSVIIGTLAEAAFKLLVVGRVKIGWVVCQPTEQVSIKQCFRCLEFGYIVTVCTNDCHWCRKFEEGVHLIKACKTNSECMLCEGKKGIDCRQTIGSGRCPVFRMKK